MTTALNRLIVNGDRLMRNIFELAEVGKLPNSGVCRLAFSTEDLLARQLVQTWMSDAGMTVRIDAAGNIIGRYPGKHADAPALATGSHIDTVPVGGRYDGCLGVLAGIEIVRVLNEHKRHLNHPIEVIVFTDEERSVIGSKAIAGEVKQSPDAYSRLDGTPIQPCLAKIGGDWEQIQSARRDRSSIAAFVELHVEQGGIMEHHQVPVGIVTGVVGQYRFLVTVLGRPNHAGTTPMNMRQDALLAAAKMVVAVNQIAVETPGDHVATVGYMDVSPNATNTVPGKVVFRIDLRDLDQAHLDQLVHQIQQDFAAIATDTNTTFTMQQTLQILPTLAATNITNAIAQVCQDLSVDFIQLPSRAGHDAQEIGRITDMGMIFVPSQAGISHAEDEYTTPEHCALGATILLETFFKLDQLSGVHCRQVLK
jgi:beta-ureidopropionase / N-carbamoyl-L-amino-acid hydrolase